MFHYYIGCGRDAMNAAKHFEYGQFGTLIYFVSIYDVIETSFNILRHFASKADISYVVRQGLSNLLIGCGIERLSDLSVLYT